MHKITAYFILCAVAGTQCCKSSEYMVIDYHNGDWLNFEISHVNLDTLIGNYDKLNCVFEVRQERNEIILNTPCTDSMPTYFTHQLLDTANQTYYYLYMHLNCTESLKSLLNKRLFQLNQLEISDNSNKKEGKNLSWSCDLDWDMEEKNHTIEINSSILQFTEPLYLTKEDNNTKILCVQLNCYTNGTNRKVKNLIDLRYSENYSQSTTLVMLLVSVLIVVTIILVSILWKNGKKDCIGKSNECPCHDASHTHYADLQFNILPANNGISTQPNEPVRTTSESPYSEIVGVIEPTIRVRDN